MLSLIKTPKVSGKAALALFSQEQVRALLVLDLELGPLLLDATITTFNHVVYGDVTGFKHGVKVEGRGAGGMHLFIVTMALFFNRKVSRGGKENTVKL
jgi:hypothetical protein